MRWAAERHNDEETAVPTRNRRLAITIAVTALAAAACTSQPAPAPSSTSPAAATSTGTPSTSTTTAAPVPPSTFPASSTSFVPVVPLVDRLVIIAGDGNVVTMKPDGQDQEHLTDDAGTTTGYFQPIWSPDGSSVVVSRIAPDGFTLLNVDIGAGTSSTVPTQSNAFYFYWSPTSDRLAYLSNGSAGLDLAVASFGAEPVTENIAAGAPFYFSWSPDGTELATLVGRQDLSRLPAEPGAAATDIAPPGDFVNPVWTDAGLYYVSPAGGVDRLVVEAADGSTQVLARAPASTAFTATRDGDRVAVQSVGELNGIEASYQEAPLLPLNRVVVIERATGELTSVTEGPAVAFFWSPAGDQLLVLDTSEASGTLRWQVWANGELHRLVDFVPSPVFFDTFLPFFSQYALSMSLWAPDGTAFAFPGLIEGSPGIYVQNVSGGPPTLVAEGGDWVTWSP